MRLGMRARLAVATALLLPAATLRAQSADLPIFDTHIHYSAPDWTEYPEARILAILQQAGVKRALVSSTPDEGTIKLYQKDPQRIVPILRPYRTREDMGHWWQDPSVIPYLESRLALKVHKGIGEFHLYGGQVGTPVIKRLTEIVLREGIYLHAHSDEVAIVELFTLEPRLKVIWAHAGMSSGPQAVGALLDRYATLWVDLALRNGDVAPGGTLDPGWRALFLRHPDRFLAGTDTWVTSRWEALPSSVTDVRAYLKQLPPDVAEKIAYKNAERLFP
ncbi:MAG TPA: amidohydrolase family protein [Verrucomicrobiae bacterium]|jgi:amidohydrolase family protein|nr:amidohydrolase family protein [Verrucomicrobiae bacterium]